MSPLTAQDVCQVLRDIALERRNVTRACVPSWDEIFAAFFTSNQKVGDSTFSMIVVKSITAMSASVLMAGAGHSRTSVLMV